jgi:Tfp pilus assembly protein PilF
VEPSFPAKKLCVQKALEIADRSVKLTPKSAESYTLRANVRLDPIIADRTGARADIAKALELMPGHPQALHSRAKLHFQERNYEEALADLDRSGYSKNIDGMMLKAKILYLQTKFPVALKEVDRLLQREPSNIEALMLRAFTRVSMKDKKNARQDLLAAREIAVKQGRTDVLHAIDRYLKQEKLDSDR